MTCSIDGCERPHHSKGYCDAHRQRVRATGDPRPDIPIGHIDRATVPEMVVTLDAAHNRRLARVPFTGDLRAYIAELDRVANQ